MLVFFYLSDVKSPSFGFVMIEKELAAGKFHLEEE